MKKIKPKVKEIESKEYLCVEYGMYSQTFKKLFTYNNDRVIFQDGWWFDKLDYDKLIKSPRSYGIDRNNESRQLTLFLMPNY